LEPGNTLGFMGKGRNAYNRERYKEAADLFSYSIKLDRSFSQAYAFRAGCFFNLNRTAEAVDDVITALGLDGNDMAFDLMMTSEDSVAQMFLTKLMIQKNKQPEEAMWPFYIGVFNETHKHYMEAVDCYTESMNISANDALYERIAFCYNELGYHELALENINRAIETDHDDANYVALKASLLYNIGRGQEAIEAYDEYIKMKPDFFAGYYQRGFLKDNLKDTDGAI
jgi:tetratricopeptide (TPR) repeat protein